MPIAQSPSPSHSAARVRELPFDAPPAAHRHNFIAWLLLRRQRKRATICPYLYLKSYLAMIRRNPLGSNYIHWEPDLKSVFGLMCGTWLYTNLHRSVDYNGFVSTLEGFKDPFVPGVKDTSYVPPTQREMAASRAELIAAQKQFRRDEQHTNRVALIAHLRERAGTVAPRGFTHRWNKGRNHAQRYDRVTNRLEHLFGDRAAKTLDSTHPVSRSVLAACLEDIDRDELRSASGALSARPFPSAAPVPGVLPHR